MTPVNDMLGRYEILEEIGHGGFATVYRARDTTLGREVALKLLDPLLMRDEAFVARFEQEGRAAAGLEHPHIVPIYEVGSTQERLYIAMRLVRGKSLAHRLQAEPRIPWGQTLELLRQVSDALEYAHDQGIVHRDIKPHNILLDPRSGAMLSDFGFARLVGTSSLTQSVSGGIVGTPAYIAPEIWDGAQATPATDVYSLACVVCEMLTGRVLFGGETPMAVMRAHDRGAVLPAQWPADVPAEIGPVLARAVARDPAQRYGRVRELVAGLAALQTAAVKERAAKEAARLLGEVRQELKAGRFEEAAAGAKGVLELAPESGEGARLLQEAQEKLEKRRRLAAEIEEKRSALAADQKALDEEKAGVAARLAELEAKSSRLEAARAEAARTLRKAIDGQEQAGRERDGLRLEADRLAPRARHLARRAEQLQNAAGSLSTADFEMVQRWLAMELDRGVSQSPLDSVTQAEGPALAVTRAHAGKAEGGAVVETKPVETEADPAEASWLWVLLAAIVIVVAIILGASGQ
jgi:hypothetical protein